MKYLKSFKLLDDYKEHCAMDVRTIFNSSYPFHIFPEKELEEISFREVTILCGGNGSGKTTLLNIIADKLGAKRKNSIDKGPLFKSYVNACASEQTYENPIEIKMISSDDVFDYLLDIRAINTGINRRKDKLADEFLKNKFYSGYASIGEYEAVKNECDAKRKSMSNYIRERLVNNNIVEQSNGQSALLFWEREIGEKSIYILDEPENSLSAENQLKLKKFIEDSVRFYDCQFIISTHSPFLLAIHDAKIYDLDAVPVCEKKWNELANVRTYYEFFKDNEREFESDK